MDDNDMKMRVARSIKWNVIDKVSSQILYAVTGIVLARVLSQEDFGLVGAVLVFQAFASLFVDSGFSSALIQRKSPTRLDYSTVLWFNLGMAVGIYLLLYFCAPYIAHFFQDDQRLIPLQRVMYLTFIINATAIVQTNRLMKMMDVKMIAISNSIGLIISAVVGIWMALRGFGAWAIVWQSITLATTKSLILWATGRWWPLIEFSWKSLISFFKVGFGVMTSSFLNTLFQNIYSFFIGNRVGLNALGNYTQADKWSKMGIASLSQVLTASFLPALSEYQDDSKKFAAATSKMNRFTSYLLFPAVGLLIAISTPLFHVLFGTKWDAAIALFCILLLRGIFTVITSLYNNFILSLGHAKTLVLTEVIRDVAALIAIFITLPFIGLSTPEDTTLGIRILLWGQFAASGITWFVTLILTSRLTKIAIVSLISDNIPYLSIALIATAAAWSLTLIVQHAFLLLCLQLVIGGGIYLLINHILKSKIQHDVIGYLTRRLHVKS